MGRADANRSRFSIERRRRILPFGDPAEFDHRVDGLRKAELIPWADACKQSSSFNLIR
ncbi:hypothetical protein [Sinorhizobium alkalisoli]|uniref:hypothetical protein n=1 Tax=Sinorhizobium alkalisoli TaxID=1752398 RepID=UPI00178C45E2|nr:hypothetical protein [Sinorhizobium alkalisoli]